MTSVTIQSFHADLKAAEQASAAGPVFITEDGQPKRVLIDIDEYRRLSLPSPVSAPSLSGAPQTASSPAGPYPNEFAIPEEDYFEWEPERLHNNLTTVEQ